jgi:hypothetical protein
VSLPTAAQASKAGHAPPASAPIYPYIPPACSLVWNRYEEPPSPVKVHASFSPDWFSSRMGLDLGQRWHTDPVHRRQSFVSMAEALNTAFPQLGLGGDPRSIRGGLSQVHTCAPVAALFGQEVQYSPGAWPENRRVMLTDEKADELEVPRLSRLPIVEQLMDQMDVIDREWGAVDGELNYQGVLNTAFRLRGEQIFMDMAQAPERAHHVLSVVCETTLLFADLVYARQRKSGVRKDWFVTSNCVVNMISEAHYREFVMPYDRKISGHFAHFGIHNCGWTVDAYAAAYAEIRPLGYLDFGIRSDLHALGRMFPGTVLTVILNPDDVIGKPAGDIRAMLARLHDALGSCRIIIGSLDGRTDPAEVGGFFRAAAAEWGVPVECLVPRPHYG